MSKSLELRQDRSLIVDEMRSLVEKNDKLEGDVLNRWKELDAKQKSMLADIEAREATEALDAELRSVKSPNLPQVGQAEQRVNAVSAMKTRAAELHGSEEYRKAFDSFVRTGKTNEVLEEMRTYNAMGDSTQGTLIPVGFQKELEVKLKAVGGIRQVARVITTASGNALHWPTADDTANNGSWIAENTTVNQTNPSFSEVVLNANLASSDQVIISLQLLQDNAVNIESYLADSFGLRLGRLTNIGYTTGSGSGQPSGLITGLVADGTRNVSAVGAYSNDGVSTDINSVGSDDLDNLINKLDPAYRANGTFMANQSTYDALRKVKDKYGRSIWAAGLTDGAPDTIRGYRYVYNQNMAAIGANNISMVFGDFTKYIIRDVLGFTMVRFNELFMSAHQVGFQAFLRTDGKLLQPAAFSQLLHPAT